MIYFDYNATTPLAGEALAAMLPLLQRDFGNPSSTHRAGRNARAAIDLARDQVARLLGATAGGVIFTGGGTEANNLAIIGLARANRAAGRHLVTTEIEHPAVLHSFDQLENRENFCVTRLPVSRVGQISLDHLRDALTDETILVSVMAANNETGVTQPIEEAALLCRERGILFHTDAVQAFGKKRLNWTLFDALSIAAHKFYGPKGAGALVLRPGISIAPLQIGGSHENSRRAGTENSAAIAGMACAAAMTLATVEEEAERLAVLRDQLWTGIAALYPEARWNGFGAEMLSNTLNVTFPGMKAESHLMSLDLSGICASSGSACMVGGVTASHVLRAMGVDESSANSAIRFSLGSGSTTEEVSEAVELMGGILNRQKLR